MISIRISETDANCRYLVAPQSADESPFGEQLKKVGIRLPARLSLRTSAARGWLRPRLRVAIPAAALLSWKTFPEHPAGDENCPPSDLWGLEVWKYATSTMREYSTTAETLWMHWLDDLGDATTVNARKHSLDPARDPEPAAFAHPHWGSEVHPWIDYFAYWQVYHTAELIREATLTVPGLTDQTTSLDTYLRERAREFDQNVQVLAARWEKWGAFFDIVGCYRTIMARCLGGDSFTRDVRAGARAFASQRGIDAAEVNRGIRDVLLRLWQRWKDAPPVADSRLMLGLQQDIQCATRLWSDLSGEAVDPLDRYWFSRNRERGDSAMLIDALPHEEWLAKRDFARQAAHYQRDFPHPYPMGERQLADLLAEHWAACPALRRFCLAWVRLHAQLQSHDANGHADQTIAANERIEQFNLVGLHTERVVRYVAAVVTTSTGKQAKSNEVMRNAIKWSLATAARSVSITDQRLDGWIKQHTSLHAMPDLTHNLCLPSTFATGDVVADQLIAAHIHALIARNYAAHHDYFDDKMIGAPGAQLLSGCLLVVVAALHTLPPNKNASRP